MKLEGIVLAAIVLAAMENACANGATDSPLHGGGGSGGAAENGSGGSSGFGGSAGSGGAGGDAGAYATTDSGSPYSTPDTGAPVFDSGFSADSVVISPPIDSGMTYEGGIDPACAAEGTVSACAECCGTGEPSGVNTLNAAIQACACGTTGACASECATEVCASIPATEGDACYTCLSAALATTGPCDTPVHTTCTADPSCSAYLSCESAECSGLP